MLRGLYLSISFKDIFFKIGRNYDNYKISSLVKKLEQWFVFNDRMLTYEG